MQYAKVALTELANYVFRLTLLPLCSGKQTLWRNKVSEISDMNMSKW